MGINYYLHSNRCPTCGRSDEPLHIGKSSAGWCFHLHVYPDRNINSLKDWWPIWNKHDSEIRNEEGEVLSADKLLLCITGCRTAVPREPRWGIPPFGYATWADFHRENDSEQGPKGLLWSVVDGVHCVGHGEGTWDLMVGDFR